MTTDIHNPNASVTIGLSGLAVCCFNKTFNNNRGRWEIAIPRFADHSLSVEITGIGTFFIEPQVKFIEIIDRASIKADPTFEGKQKLDRTNRANDKNDFRWLTDFSNELPHRIVSVISPKRVPFTMLYVHDATAYTKDIDPVMLIRPDLKQTRPIENGTPKKLPDTDVIPLLDGTKSFLFEARTMGMDIESYGGDALDILFDRASPLTIPHGAQPRQILISNLEIPGKPQEEILEERFIEAQNDFYALGDFYRYYELFEVAGQEIHQWGKQPKDGSGTNGDCCCNPSTVALVNLNDFLTP